MEGNMTPLTTSPKAKEHMEKNDSAMDIASFTPNSNRKSFVIPKLDEKQLEMKLPEAQGTAQSFVLLEGTANVAVPEGVAISEGISAPLNITPTFLVGPGNMYSCGTMLTVDSPSANAAFIANTQQFHQCKVPQTPTTEQEFLLTQNYIQMYPREVLAFVLSSVIRDNPALCSLIRQRCEKALVFLSQQQQKQQQQQQAMAAGRFATHVGSGAQWGSRLGTSNYNSPHGTSFGSNASPHAGGGRKGRGGKHREEALCSVHNSMRSLNHLHLNKQTGLYECVSGFHCLEDGGSAAVTPSNFKNAAGASTGATSTAGASTTGTNTNTNTMTFMVSDTATANQTAGGGQAILATLPGHLVAQRDCKHVYDGRLGENGAVKTGGNNANANGSDGEHGREAFSEGNWMAAQQHNTELRVEMLQSLLQSVRERELEEK